VLYRSLMAARKPLQMDAAYHPDFGTTVNYTFDPLPDDPDGQVAGAIKKVCDYIHEDARTEVMREQAARCIAEGNGDPITGIWNHIKRSLQFRQDSDIADDLDTQDPRIKDVVEVFIRPVDQALLIQLRGMGVEDCDGYTLYGACLLLVCGIHCKLVTIAADNDDPTRFSHIYVAAYVTDAAGASERIPLDFSHGPYMGWEGPHLGRIREWPVEESAAQKLLRTLAPVALLAVAYIGIRYWRTRRIAA
jgi:hypothetical protein